MCVKVTQFCFGLIKNTFSNKNDVKGSTDYSDDQVMALVVCTASVKQWIELNEVVYTPLIAH